MLSFLIPLWLWRNWGPENNKTTLQADILSKWQSSKSSSRLKSVTSVACWVEVMLIKQCPLYSPRWPCPPGSTLTPSLEPASSFLAQVQFRWRSHWPKENPFIKNVLTAWFLVTTIVPCIRTAKMHYHCWWLLLLKAGWRLTQSWWRKSSCKAVLPRV